MTTMPEKPTTGNGSLSYWIDTTPPTALPPLDADVDADVAVIGGGIAGLTAAYLLAKAGKRVVLLERDRVALAETGHTTAHLQIVSDTRLKDLVARWGLDGAKLIWDSQLEAVRLIEQIGGEEKISCELERLDAFLYTVKDDERAMLEEELRLTRKIGYAAEWADPTGDVPFPAKHALRFPDQGKFHVRKYLAGVLAAAQRHGARIFEKTEVEKVEEGASAKVVTRDGHVVTAAFVVHATNVPLFGASLDTRLTPMRTYAIGARVPRGTFGRALYYDTLDPYHYTRVEPQGEDDLVILGGEDHEAGAMSATELAWGRLYQYLGEAVEDFTPQYQWSGEVIETDDDLPYIGRAPGRPENEFVITGDSGTGMTNGTLGALIVSERILGRGTPFDALVDSMRPSKAERGKIADLAHKGLKTVQRVAKIASFKSDIKDIAELGPGEGAIVKHGLKPVALARLEDGTLCAVSGICTHSGCVVGWNHGEQSWDCACHGSRFAPQGHVLHGPANEPLAPADLDAVLADRKETPPRRES